MKKAISIAVKLLAFALLLVAVVEFFGETEPDSIASARDSVGIFAGPCVVLGKFFWAALMLLSGRLLAKSAH